MTFQVDDLVRLIGKGWNGNGVVPLEGDIYTVYRIDKDHNALIMKDNHEWYVTEDRHSRWGGILVEETEVEMTRLPRERKGKTPIDIGIVTQDGLTRVRLSMGEDGTPGRKNSDLSFQEAQDLITLLEYNLGVAKGDIVIS